MSRPLCGVRGSYFSASSLECTLGSRGGHFLKVLFAQQCWKGNAAEAQQIGVIIRRAHSLRVSGNIVFSSSAVFTTRPGYKTRVMFFEKHQTHLYLKYNLSFSKHGPLYGPNSRRHATRWSAPTELTGVLESTVPHVFLMKAALCYLAVFSLFFLMMSVLSV